MNTLKTRFLALLRWSERYTKTDMAYLATTGLWSNANTIFVSLASFLLYIIFNRYVSKDAYGTYQYLLSVGAIVGAFTLTGMNGAVTRAVALGQEGALRAAVRAQLRWAVVPLLGSWAIGAYYLFLHNNSTLGWGFFLIGIFVPLNNAFNTYAAFLQGKKDFKRGFLYSLWWNVPYYLVVGVVAIFFKAALLLLAANLISQAIGLFIAYKRTLITYKPNTVSGEETLTYGNHLSIMGLLGSVAGQMDSILTFHFLGAANLAIYSFATAIPDRIGTLFKFLPTAAFPKFVGRSPREIRVGLARRLLLGTLVALAIAGCYALVAHFIFALLFPSYLSSVGYSQWYALSLGGVLTGVVVNALTAAGDVRALYRYNIVSPLFTLALELGGILLFGLDGLIGARIIGSLFALGFAMFLYWRIE